MCGRYTLRTPLSVLARQFQFDLEALTDDVVPRYNIAPSQTVLAIRQPAPGSQRELARFAWGLIPSWAKDNKGAYACINARSDTVATKPTFRAAFKKRRCLVIADGYYEWHTEGKEKQPFLFEIDGGQPFALAGLWETWHGPDGLGTALKTCSLLTTEANELCAEIHNRMPVILSPNDYDRWLDPANEDAISLQRLLRPFPAETMTVRPVNRYVNTARNEGEQCIAAP